ncbi:MAG: hypothetical protein V3V96_13410 [Acidiferrobacterales bacterium]
MKTESERSQQQKGVVGRTVMILGAIAIALYLYTIFGGLFD